jgi:hypothetical protein
VSAQCPRGHVSATTDYCDECGTPIDAVAASAAPPDDEIDDDDVTATAGVAGLPPPTEVERCPKCQSSRRGTDRFCEVDGYDFVKGGPTDAPLRWEAVVAADREYYDAVAPDDVEFPSHYEPRTFRLEADEILIGRKSTSRGIEPDLDLSGPDEDEAISRRHAVLVRAADGSYAVVDRGSTNGTSLNGSTALLAVDEPTTLHDGDRINIGAWTSITIRIAH